MKRSLKELVQFSYLYFITIRNNFNSDISLFLKNIPNDFSIFYIIFNSYIENFCLT